MVKTTGDGLLVEFGSVVDALRCAVDVQREMTERNTGVPADNRIELRIGINVGDIVVEDGDIFGDGVNVAARLEALAEPGGICVAARVQEDAAGKLDLAFEDIGEQTLPIETTEDITAAAAQCPVFQLEIYRIVVPDFAADSLDVPVAELSHAVMSAAQQELIQFEHGHVKNVTELPLETSGVGGDTAQVIVSRDHSESGASAVGGPLQW